MGGTEKIALCGTVADLRVPVVRVLASDQTAQLGIVACRLETPGGPTSTEGGPDGGVSRRRVAAASHANGPVNFGGDASDLNEIHSPIRWQATEPVSRVTPLLAVSCLGLSCWSQ